MATTERRAKRPDQQSADSRPDPTTDTDTDEQDDRLEALPSIERNDHGTLQSVCCGASIATVARGDGTIGTACDECGRDL